MYLRYRAILQCHQAKESSPPDDHQTATPPDSTLKNVSEILILHIRKILINGVQTQMAASYSVPLCVFSSEPNVCHGSNNYYKAQTDAASHKSSVI
jgi:hypothetical protein